jgi:hypothetical protein
MYQKSCQALAVRLSYTTLHQAHVSSCILTLYVSQCIFIRQKDLEIRSMGFLVVMTGSGLSLETKKVFKTQANTAIRYIYQFFNADIFLFNVKMTDTDTPTKFAF